MRLVYGGGGGLHGFVDADWVNPGNMKSVGGYVFLFGGAAVSWLSKKQSLATPPTEEAECTVFTKTSRKTLWLRRILLDIENRGNQINESSAPSPTITCTGNQAATKHAKSEGITARTKHFDICPQHSRGLQHKALKTRQKSSPKGYPHWHTDCILGDSA